MSGFEKIKLATGEFRGEYIQRRLQEGISVKAIHGEINHPDMYSGPEGKSWPESVIYAEKRKLGLTRKGNATPAVETAPRLNEEPQDDGEVPDLTPAEVPAEYEDILDPEDVKEVYSEAAAALKKKQRALARKELLAQATRELEHEAKLAQERGRARGDMVDVVINLAPYTADIRLDGKSYMHGRTYRVTRKVAAVLQEQMQRSWQHQEGLNGKNERPYRRTLADRGITANNAPGVRA